MPSWTHKYKRVIREEWCKPLIKFIHDTLGKKLTYLGLPSPEAQDVLCWLEYIDYVIAFQCREYPEPSSAEQDRDAVLKLQDKLLALERKKQIESFSLYDGYIEEVLIRGTDTVGKVYQQERIVTVYNLDFCNAITVPLSYVDGGAMYEAYKSEAIQKLLWLQKECSCDSDPAKFVMFLTIHSDFFPKEEERFLMQKQEADVERYLRKVKRVVSSAKNLRILRAYVYQIVREFFRTAQFSVEFLPTIYYHGLDSRDRENWLVHFTMIGAHNRNPSGIAPCFQESAGFLNQMFLQIGSDERFQSMSTDGFTENPATRNSVDAFKNSQVFEKLWQ